MTRKLKRPAGGCKEGLDIAGEVHQTERRSCPSGSEGATEGGGGGAGESSENAPTGGSTTREGRGADGSNVAPHETAWRGGSGVQARN